MTRRGKAINKIGAAFALVIAASASVMSDTMLDTPPELIGFFGKNREQCRAFLRRNDGITSFTRENYNLCSMSVCQARVVSHQRVRGGYILNLKSPIKPKGWKERVELLAEGGIKIAEIGYDNKAQKLVKCAAQDAIDGIGQRAETLYQKTTPSIDAGFAALYALEIPHVCPQLRVKQATAMALVTQAQRAWELFKREHGLKSTPGLSPTEDARRMIAVEKLKAENAVRQDEYAIDNFCRHVLDFYGPGGKFTPALIDVPGQDI